MQQIQNFNITDESTCTFVKNSVSSIKLNNELITETNYIKEIGDILETSPPKCFYEWANLFPCLQVFLDNIEMIRSEVQNVPKWIPWPEDHYGKADNYEWTVFPFLHTFPAMDTTKMTWIGSTNELCPGISTLLKGVPNVRTALLSKLGPGTHLEFHMGWEDLANHVLRCHIPIHIPLVGPSGLTVKEETKHYKDMEIIVFDDSLVHMAFNSCLDEHRIVLIIDIMRPPHISKGTVKGGHTKELNDLLLMFK